MPAQKVAIVVCTPSLGTVSMLWHKSVLDLAWPMNTMKAVLPIIDRNGGEIGEMRNRLVEMALECEKDDVQVDSIFWLDDDVICHRACMLALAAHDVEVASGCYFDKGDMGNRPLIFPGPSSGTLPFRPNEVYPAWGWSNGLCMVKLDVYKRIKAMPDLPKDRYGQPAYYKMPDFGIDDKGNMTTGGTEDFHFFGLVEKLGVTPVMDNTKFAFGWHYDAKKQIGYPEKQWNQLMKREPITWDTKGGVVIWD